MSLSESDLQEIYTWVDSIPLSRPKRSITRDFSDGCLISEIVKYFFPRLVELHNYQPSNSITQKLYNWNTLNNKIFKKMNFNISKEDIEAVVNCERGAIERVLLLCKHKMSQFQDNPEPIEHQQELKPTPQPKIPTTKLVHNEVKQALNVPTSKLIHTEPKKNILNLQQQQQFQHIQSQPPKSIISPKAVSKSKVTSQDENNDRDIFRQQEKSIVELRETVDVLQLKIGKLEQLLRLKDSKIETLQQRLARVNM